MLRRFVAEAGPVRSLDAASKGLADERMSRSRDWLRLVHSRPQEDPGRRIRGQLTPVVKATEDLLDDYHSTQMLYKVLKALYREQRLDLFLRALGVATEVGEMDASANLGAVFVSEIKRLGQEERIDVGLAVRSESAPVGTQLPATKAPARSSAFVIPGYGDSSELWDLALKQLQHRMPKSGTQSPRTST